MIGNCDMMNLYDAEKNPFLKNTKNLVPRIVIYGQNINALCLIEKQYPKTYYCFFSIFGFVDKENYRAGDVVKKLSLGDYFRISNRFRLSNIKFNLKKIIYDSNRNKTNNHLNDIHYE